MNMRWPAIEPTLEFPGIAMLVTRSPERLIAIVVEK
jgi:hypothetical protein